MRVKCQNATQGRALALTLMLCAVTVVTVMTGFAANAHASGETWFCNGASVAPYGQSGDRCWGPGQNLRTVTGTSAQHSVCVNAANNGNLVTSWVCGAAGGWPTLGFGCCVWKNGVIRNNNSSLWTVIEKGWEEWY